MKKYHVATADGKSYYGCGYESYSEAKALLKIAQAHDPQAHIVVEECCFANADHIRAMSDEELAVFLCDINKHCPDGCPGAALCKSGDGKANGLKKWLKRAYEKISE